MVSLLVDTDVLVDHLRGASAFRPRGATASYSSVTRCELFAGARAQEEHRVEALLAPFPELPVDRLVAERAGRLRRRYRIAIADALIAATAMEHRLTLLTRNVRDFAGVRGLRARAPR